MKLDFSSVWQYWPFLYHGALTTLKITAMAGTWIYTGCASVADQNQ